MVNFSRHFEYNIAIPWPWAVCTADISALLRKNLHIVLHNEIVLYLIIINDIYTYQTINIIIIITKCIFQEITDVVQWTLSISFYTAS